MQSPNDSQHQNHSFIKIAVLFYGACGLVALIWSWITASPRNLFYSSSKLLPGNMLFGSLLGIILALGSISTSHLCLRYTHWASQLFRWFKTVLGNINYHEVLVLALLSSGGEELLFRGAMLHTLGLEWTSILFCLAHFPPRWALLPWTISAGVIGTLLGIITLKSENLFGAMIAHFLINWWNLRLLIKRPND